MSAVIRIGDRVRASSLRSGREQVVSGVVVATGHGLSRERVPYTLVTLRAGRRTHLFSTLTDHLERLPDPR